MALSREITLTIDNYNITLDKEIKIYEYDAINLCFTIQECGIVMRDGKAHNRVMPVVALKAYMLIETPQGTDSVEATNIVRNKIMFSLGNKYSRFVGTGKMQIILKDFDGCRITLPEFNYEVKQSINTGWDDGSFDVLITEKEDIVITDELGRPVETTKISEMDETDEITPQTYTMVINEDGNKKIKLDTIIESIGETIEFDVEEIDRRIDEMIDVYDDEEIEVEFPSLHNDVERIKDEINEISESLDNKANKSETQNIQQQINNLVLGAVGDGNNAEVVQARGEFKTLNDRFNYNSIDNLVDISTNILNTNECVENASIGWDNAMNGYNLNKTETANNFCLSPLYEVSEGQTFIFNSKGYQANIFLSGSDYKLIDSLTIEANTPFTIPSNRKYMRYRFTINSNTMNEGQWKNKVMLCKGSEIPKEFTPYNSKILKENIELKNYSKKSESIQFEKIDKRDNSLLQDKMIVIPSFDGMDINTFDTVVPYMKDKGLSFTIFSAGSTDKSLIERFQNVQNYGGEIQFYNGQPALTYEGDDNYIEQYEQFKEKYDNFLKMCVGKPKFLAYSGGRYTHITEKIAKSFGIKWARTTESDWLNAKKWNDDLFNTPAFFTNNDNYTTMINISDWDIQNKMIRPFLNHSILSENVTDTSYNIEWNKLKSILDKLYELKEAGKIYVMNYSQAFDYIRFPKDADIGYNVLVYESDGRQHQYVKTISGWRELTI